MTQSEHTARQREFYDSRRHRGLQPRSDDHYARKLTAFVVQAAGIESHHRVLEVGAGFGRFTFPLLDHCGSVTALDLSEQALMKLEAARDERGIAVERCRAVRADLAELEVEALGAPHDVVVGFFVLQHLEDVDASLRRLASCARPGGVLAFLEPNRWNPLFVAQVACCPDMSWREEKGVFALSARGVEESYLRSGLEPAPLRRCGFFAPQLLNRFEWARRAATRLERQPWLRRLLPFLVLSARVPSATACESVSTSC